MLKIRLETRSGDFVVFVNVPLFDPPMDVLVWGTRVFQRVTDDVYRECMIFYVPRECTIDGDG
jgi:hypothetical protein